MYLLFDLIWMHSKIKLCGRTVNRLIDWLIDNCLKRYQTSYLWTNCTIACVCMKNASLSDLFCMVAAYLSTMLAICKETKQVQISRNGKVWKSCSSGFEYLHWSTCRNWKLVQHFNAFTVSCLPFCWQNVTQRELMKLFEGDIKIDIINSTHCSISKEHFWHQNEFHIIFLSKVIDNLILNCLITFKINY